MNFSTFSDQLGIRRKSYDKGDLINVLNDYLNWLGNQKGILSKRARNDVKHVIYVARIQDLKARIPKGQN